MRKAEMQRVPPEMVELQNKIMEQAQKSNFTISKIEALRVIAKSYKTK